MFEPGDQPVETVAPLGVLKHLDLVDDDGPDVLQRPSCPESVIDPLVGPHHDGSVDVPVPCRAGLGEVEAAHPNLESDSDKVTVTVAEPLVFLVRKRDQRDQKEHSPPPFEEVLHPGHLPDEGLAARGGGYDEEVLPFEEPVLDGELLDGHEVVDTGGLRERRRERQIGDMGRLLDLVRFEPVKEGPRPVGTVGSHRRENPVEVADLDEEFFKVHEHRAAEPADIAEFPAYRTPVAGSTGTKRSSSWQNRQMLIRDEGI